MQVSIWPHESGEMEKVSEFPTSISTLLWKDNKIKTKKSCPKDTEMEESMGLKETCLGSLHFEWRGVGGPLLQPGRQEAGFLHHVLWPFSEQYFFIQVKIEIGWLQYLECVWMEGHEESQGERKRTEE